MNPKPIIFSVLLIIVMGLVVYANSLKGAFVYDDQIWIGENNSIAGWENLQKIFTSNIGAGAGRKYNFYRPLLSLTLMADYSLGGADVRVYHLTNVLFHISVALCIYWLVNILFSQNLLSLLSALFFVVHPIHTEAVSYISGRGDPMCVFFLLLTFIFYIKQPRPRVVSAFLISACYLLAIFSKENAVILPFLILMYHCFFGGFKFNRFLEIGVITLIYAILRSTVLYFPAASTEVHSTLLERIPGFFVAITNYTRLLIFPFNLHMEYGDFLFSLNNPKALFGILILFSAIVYAFKSVKKDRLVSFSIAWFLVALFPESNIYRINAYMYEHWLYLPSIGFFLILANYLSWAYNNRKLKIFAVMTIVGLLFFYSYLTTKQNAYWRDPVSFYQRTLQYSPFSARLYNNLALLYSSSGDKEEAIKLFKKAISINPKYSEAYNNLAVVYTDIGKYAVAIELYKKAIAVNPDAIEIDLAGAYSNLGNAYGKAGQYDEAVAIFKKAIEMNPNLASTYNNLAIVYQQMGDYEEAGKLLEIAVKIDPKNFVIRFNLGNTYAALNRIEEAVKVYKQVIRLDPNNAAAYNNIGFLLKNTGKNDEAIPFFNAALQLNPKLTEAYENVSIAYLNMGKNKEAASECRRAIQADPLHANKYNYILHLIDIKQAKG